MIKKFMLNVAGIVLMANGFAITAGASGTVTEVYPGNQQGWSFINDQTDGPGDGTFVKGPGNPPIGVGSAQLKTNGPGDGQGLAKSGFQGVKLTDLTALKYSTYQASSNASDATAIALQLNVDRDVGDSDNSYQGRIVYEPYYNNDGTVPKGEWNQWDTLNDGKFWLSKSSQKFDNNCPQSNPCTLSQITALYPEIGIHPTLGAIVFKAGSGWTDPFSGNVDEFTIGVDGDSTTYDFEPTLSPGSKDDCKSYAWKTFNTPEFKNQGDCVSYVANHGKSNKH